MLRVGLASAGSDTTGTVLPETMLVTGFANDQPTVTAMLRDLVSECERPHGVVGNRIVTLLASIAVSSWHARGCAPHQWLMQVNDPDLAKAVAAIRGAPGREWTVEELARIALASRTSFAARFRTATGQTPGRYLASVRIEHAKRQLASSDLSIGAIGHRLGYGSQTAFGRAFRRHTGLTPTQWRQRRLG
ncbi:helix-turn-helix domain-containing protein [Nocardia arthritidis]|uniref:Helix-turn-helix domain-containing protein n=1 Tax=Nocardia arthritidis TaxID=228602 RepID=A0A6G9YGX3_9NOCA|nr:AraC family transcriptional regulator [Nocardia arthritidis]QIS12400.1 helix-turn-helix domain-containing protein [Nocardia arthritidis]